MSIRLSLIGFLCILTVLFIPGCTAPPPDDNEDLEPPYENFSIDDCYSALRDLLHPVGMSVDDVRCAHVAYEDWYSCRGPWPCICTQNRTENQPCSTALDRVEDDCGCDAAGAVNYLEQEGKTIDDLLQIASEPYNSGLV